MVEKHVENSDNTFILCKRCHRKLKDEASKQLGFGKTCYKKYCRRKPTYLFEVNTNEIINK